MPSALLLRRQHIPEASIDAPHASGKDYRTHYARDNDGAISIDFSLSEPAPTGGLTVNLSWSGDIQTPRDVDALPASVAFAGGATTASISVDPVNQVGWFKERISDLSIVAGAGYDLRISSSTYRLSVRSRLRAPVVSFGAGQTVSAGAGTFNCAVELDAASQEDVTVAIVASNTSDASPPLRFTGTITAGLTSGTVAVTIPAGSNAGETFTLELDHEDSTIAFLGDSDPASGFPVYSTAFGVHENVTSFGDGFEAGMETFQGVGDPGQPPYYPASPTTMGSVGVDYEVPDVDYPMVLLDQDGAALTNPITGAASKVFAVGPIAVGGESGYVKENFTPNTSNGPYKAANHLDGSGFPTQNYMALSFLLEAPEGAQAPKAGKFFRTTFRTRTYDVNHTVTWRKDGDGTKLGGGAADLSYTFSGVTYDLWNAENMPAGAVAGTDYGLQEVTIGGRKYIRPFLIYHLDGSTVYNSNTYGNVIERAGAPSPGDHPNDWYATGNPIMWPIWLKNTDNSRDLTLGTTSGPKEESLGYGMHIYGQMFTTSATYPTWFRDGRMQTPGFEEARAFPYYSSKPNLFAEPEGGCYRNDAGQVLALTFL